MWFSMKKVDESFLDKARMKYSVEKQSVLPIETIWDAFVSPETWHLWFPGVESASYGDCKPPFGVGTYRESSVSGFKWEETIIVWEPLKRWGYTINRGTFPISRAQIEITEFESNEEGTLVRWIIALNPRFYMWFAAKMLPRQMDKMLGKALKNLELINIS